MGRYLLVFVIDGAGAIIGEISIDISMEREESSWWGLFGS